MSISIDINEIAFPVFHRKTTDFAWVVAKIKLTKFDTNFGLWFYETFI